MFRNARHNHALASKESSELELVSAQTLRFRRATTKLQDRQHCSLCLGLLFPASMSGAKFIVLLMSSHSLPSFFDSEIPGLIRLCYAKKRSISR